LIGLGTTLRELAFIVCTTLHDAGVTAVLSGGAAATVYAPEAYQSTDLDFILQFAAATFAPSDAPLARIGFHRTDGSYHHSETAFTVEFPAGPLAIGDEVITQWSTLREHDRVLHVLNATDCVRDRLAWFLFSHDYSSLEQALAVARLHDVDLDLIESWCTREGRPEKFALFRSRLLK